MKFFYVVILFTLSLYGDNFIIKDGTSRHNVKQERNIEPDMQMNSHEPKKAIIEDVDMHSEAAKATEYTIKEAKGKEADSYVADANTVQSLYFDFDSHAITEEMAKIASSNADMLNTKEYASRAIRIEGGADERGSDEYNYALALKRAEALKNLYHTLGMDSSRISTVSLGEGSPVCGEHSEECWQKNRRADTKLVK